MTINIGPGIQIGRGVLATTPILTAAAVTTPQTYYTGVPITPFQPLIASGGSNIYNYRISMGSLPSGIVLDPLTGILSGIPSATQSATATTFTVYDSAGYHAVGTSLVTFAVYNPLAATPNTTAQLLETTVAMSPFTPLAATGGSGVYTYSYTGGTLPTGLTYNTSTGVLTGTPTVTYGTTSLTFSVQDSLGNHLLTTSTVSFTVYTKITATGSAHSFTQTVGDTIAATGTLTAANGTGTYTYYVSSGILPSGVALDPSTGILSGTVTASYTGSFVVSVRDSANVTATTTSTITFTVTGAPYTIGVVLVGGGGGGSNALGGFSGGGGGGLYTTPTTVLSGSNYIITVGAGGGGGTSGVSGSGSTISGPPAFTTVTGGGGGGASGGRAGSAGTPQNLASGGTWASGGTFNGATQGAGGGGGGASGAYGGGYGTNGLISGVTYYGGRGGAGTTTPIAPIGTVGGGGGGGVYLLNPAYTVSNQGLGGTGGGGAGGILSPTKNLAVPDGTIYTGGGGGGNWGNFGAGSGGSGLVGIVVPTLNYPGVSVTGTYTTAPNPAGTAIIWTSSGTYTA